jgi:hypothetical protein
MSTLTLRLEAYDPAARQAITAAQAIALSEVRLRLAAWAGEGETR